VPFLYFLGHHQEKHQISQPSQWFLVAKIGQAGLVHQDDAAKR
jgi:hypothetical protein